MSGKIEVGKFYMDGWGAVHGPMEKHPSEERFLIARGGTYYRDTGEHASGHLSDRHANLNLVKEIRVETIRVL